MGSNDMTVSVIIGGSRGIGLVISNQLIKRGDLVYTVSRTDSGRSNNICCDIVNNCDSIFSSIDRVDNIIFSHRYRGDDWNEAFDVTVKGVDNVMKAAIPKLSKGGSVVIISSNASYFVAEEQPAEYHSSRAALEGLMRYYAVRHGKEKIRFNCILPSTLIKPENSDFFIKGNKTREMIERITPLGRMGKAEDVADLVDFLCSSRSSFITGNSFFVDGGISLVGQEGIARGLLNLKHER